MVRYLQQQRCLNGYEERAWMMKITILCVGKIKEEFYRKAVAEYQKRLSRYCKLEIIEAADEKTPDQASPAVEYNIKEKDFAAGADHVSAHGNLHGGQLSVQHY